VVDGEETGMARCEMCGNDYDTHRPGRLVRCDDERR
jgi:hypothetical protein